MSLPIRKNLFLEGPVDRLPQHVTLNGQGCLQAASAGSPVPNRISSHEPDSFQAEVFSVCCGGVWLFSHFLIPENPAFF
jgi:hypothetical protein